MSAFEWFSIAQTAVMLLATVLLWGLRRSVKSAVEQAAAEARLVQAEAALEKLRVASHAASNWQAGIVVELEKHFMTRREYVAWLDQSDKPSPAKRRRSDG